ncbi:MAG: chloride channel protein [Acidobacteriota bacterium]
MPWRVMMPDRWSSLLTRSVDATLIRRHEDKLLLVLTLVIGALVGLVVVAFILVTENLGARFFPGGGTAWQRLLTPAVGALVAGWLLYRHFPGAAGSGIPQTKAALFLHDGFISLRTTAGKFACSSLSLASGIALGREGPSVHVGAGIASALGRRLGLGPSRVRTLVPIGSSAALAAAFNTPIAAVLFSLEEVMGNMHAPVLGSIVLSSATSWLVLHLLLGDEPLFHVPAYQLIHPLEFLVYAILGVVGGLVSAAFTKLLLAVRRRFRALPAHTAWAHPAAGGVLVGVLALFVPAVLGVGYTHVGEALNGKIAVGTMALLLVLKLVATAGCYGSGNAGGIFGPSLFLGAMMGGAVGGAAHLLFPDYTGGAGAYALVGMGAAFAGIIRTPMTSVIMIFEITRDYTIIVPLMIANLVSYFISSRFQREPIYEALQHQDGVELPPPREEHEGLLRVGRAMRPRRDVLSPGETIREAKVRFAAAPDAWLVAEGNRALGTVTPADLDAAQREGRDDSPVADLLAGPFPEAVALTHTAHVHADQTADLALQRMADAGVRVLPVMGREDRGEIVGAVSVGDILSAYGISGRKPPPPPLPSDATSPWALLGGVAAVVAVVLVLVGVLTYQYREQRLASAQRALEEGRALVRQEHTLEAVQQFRNALAGLGSNEARLELGLALITLDRLDESAIYLREVVRTDPANGPANLGLAQIAASRDSRDEAVTYYDRAIVGMWADSPTQHEIDTRFELVEFLARVGDRNPAIAQLLQLEPLVAGDEGAERRIAQRLFSLGAVQQSADLYHAILERDPENAGAHMGLGQARFVLADYAGALLAFRSASRLAPGNESAAQRLALCERIVQLDPTARRLTMARRHERSLKLLEGALAAHDGCAGEADTVLDEASSVLVERAGSILTARRRPPSLGDATDANVQLAIDLLQAARAHCPSRVYDEALTLVLARLAG